MADKKGDCDCGCLGKKQGKPTPTSDKKKGQKSR